MSSNCGAFEHEGKMVIRSVDLAKGIYSSHFNFLRTIRVVEDGIGEDFGKENFIRSEYLTVGNMKRPMYLLTHEACKAIIAACKGEKKDLLKQRCEELFNVETVAMAQKEGAIEKFTPQSLDDFGVFIKDDKPMVSSRKVAEVFEKEHQHVLRDIRGLECTEAFRLSNFGQSEYVNAQGKKQPEILMTRDGFAFLAMGFTGKRAAEFKEKYIAAFNKMEETIKRGVNMGKGVYIPNFNDPIAAAHAWIDAKKENRLLEAKIKEYEPKVLYADSVNDTPTDISMNAMSKFLCQNGFYVGQNNFFKLNLSDGLVMRKDGGYLPTQRAADLGIFRIKQTRVMINETPTLKNTLRVTVKGQKYFIKKFLGQNPNAPSIGQLPLPDKE